MERRLLFAYCWKAVPMGFLDKVLDIGIDGRGPLAGAAEVAATSRARTGHTEDAISTVIGHHVRVGAAGGFVTGLGGFITLPVAIPVNVVEFYAVATRMVAAVADLRGYDIRSPEVRTAILLTLVGNNANDVLQQAGIPVPASSGIVSTLLLNRLPKTALMVVNKAVGFRILRSVGQRTLSRLGRLVPVAGGVLGAGMDGYLMRQIGKAAKREFPIGLG
jgi:hypothetical protein